jgi:hypothetical protein
MGRPSTEVPMISVRCGGNVVVVVVVLLVLLVVVVVVEVVTVVVVVTGTTSTTDVDPHAHSMVEATTTNTARTRMGPAQQVCPPLSSVTCATARVTRVASYTVVLWVWRKWAA